MRFEVSRKCQATLIYFPAVSASKVNRTVSPIKTKQGYHNMKTVPAIMLACLLCAFPTTILATPAEQTCLATNILHEAGPAEIDRIAVANVTVNRVKSNKFKKTNL